MHWDSSKKSQMFPNFREFEEPPGTLKPTIFQWMEMVISHHFLCKDVGKNHPTDIFYVKMLVKIIQLIANH